MWVLGTFPKCVIDLKEPQAERRLLRVCRPLRPGTTESQDRFLQGSRRCCGCAGGHVHPLTVLKGDHEWFQPPSPSPCSCQWRIVLRLTSAEVCALGCGHRMEQLFTAR